MSEMIVQVRNKMLRRIGGVNHFVSHNKDYTIQFQFDESWNNVRTKMAVFAYEDGEYGSEIFDGDTCNVPEFPREGRILIGVKAGEDLSTELLCIPVCKSADDVITDEYDKPDPKIYEQILDIINNLWNGGTTVYPSPVKFLASPSAAKVGDLIRVKEIDENGDVTRTEGFDVGVELEKKINAPQVAQVGEVLTVEEVDADGKPKKWKTQTVETKAPDWNENDPTKPGYIENRTHYDSRRTAELFNVTVENVTERRFVKLADADIDISKMNRFHASFQYWFLDKIETQTFDSDGSNITIEDVSADADESAISILFEKVCDGGPCQFYLYYFKTSEAADAYTGTSGIYTPGLYAEVLDGDIKDTFVGFGEVGELKTIDSKFIPSNLPYIIQEKEDGNVKIELPYEFIEGEKYRVIYIVSGIEDKRVDELVAVYSNAAGKVGIFQGGEEYAENLSGNAYYVLSGSDSMWINEYWESSMSPVFYGIYRVVEPGYSIPSYAIDGLEQSINFEIDRFETKYDRKMLEEVGDWKYMGSKKITSDTNEINTTTLFVASNFSNVGKILVKLDLIITSSQSVDTTIKFMFNGKVMGTAPVVSSSTNKKTYWFYATEIYNNVFCILFEGDSYYDYGDINIKSMTWFNSESIQYIKISTGNPGYNVIAKNTKVTIFKAKR